MLSIETYNTTSSLETVEVLIKAGAKLEDISKITISLIKFKELISNNNVEYVSGNSSDCAICKENHANYIAIPCGHLYTCSKCVERQIKSNSKRCAICAIKADNFIRVYDATESI